MQQQLVLWRHAQPSVEAEPVVPDVFPGLHDLSGATRWLSAALARPVSLTVTRNRSTMVSFRTSQSGVRLRLHRIFFAANTEHMLALVAFVRSEKYATRLLERFVNAHAHEVEGGPMPVYTRGDTHDLATLFAEVNAGYFHDACRARVTWGPRPRSRGKHRPRPAVYLAGPGIIALHPALDQPVVPRFYVRFVIFQEMLHELYGIAAEGRRRARPPELAVLETSHPDYERARRWQGEHLPRVLAHSDRPTRQAGKLTLTTAIPPTP